MMVRACRIVILAVAVLAIQALLTPLPLRVSSSLERRRRRFASFAQSSGDKGGQKKGYQFGDISRFLAKQAATQIKKVTQKDSYEFGDLTRFLDRQAKSKVADWTGSSEYEFGDLTRFAMSTVRSRVSNFTSHVDKDRKPAYQFGDITREVLRRAQAGEYDTSDLFLALRVLLSAGVGLTPMMSMIPVRWLLDLVNLGLAQDIGGRLMEVLASALDERMKIAITGDAKYQLGDLTKKQLTRAITTFTGKDEYEFGDISRKLASLNNSQSHASAQDVVQVETPHSEIFLTNETFSDLEDWDRRFQSEKQS
jgi:hypothetical protein